MFWLYWILSIIVTSFITGSVKGLVGIKSPSVFSKENSMDVLEFALNIVVAYFLFSAIKGEWIF